MRPAPSRPPVRALLLLASLAAAPGPAQTLQLELERALPVESPELIQPSGLVSSGGKLYAVSRRHDGTVFRLDLDSGRAICREAARFQRPEGDDNMKRPEGDEGRKLDPRGLSADQDGNFYLVGAGAYRILKVTPGGKAGWMGPNLLEPGTEKGLFQAQDAGPSGLAWIQGRKFIVAAESGPRGLLRVNLDAPKPDVNAIPCDRSGLPLVAGRHPDFSDLHAEGGQLWALSKGAEAVVKLEWDGHEYSEGAAWGFDRAAGDDRYRYRGLRFGLAEGLAMDRSHVYIIEDNKGVGRQADPKDTRPLLFVFKRP